MKQDKFCASFRLFGRVQLEKKDGGWRAPHASREPKFSGALLEAA